MGDHNPFGGTLNPGHVTVNTEGGECTLSPHSATA
jgi:hypothetical protein